MEVGSVRGLESYVAAEQAIRAQGGACMIVELDLVSHASIAKAFATIRETVGDSPGTRALPTQQQPDVVMNPVKIAEAGRAVPSPPGAAGVRVWYLMSR